MLYSLLSNIKINWLSNIRNDVLAGMVVALALIPEAIAFSIIAGVDPKVGLYASFCMTIIIAFVGGRPGMISAATGAMALVMITLVKEHGLEYLLAATILTGVLQVIAGFLRLGSLMRFVSRSVVTGFVNALAILIFLAQLPEFNGAGIQMYGMVVLGLAIIYILPRFTKVFPISADQHHYYYRSHYLFWSRFTNSRRYGRAPLHVTSFSVPQYTTHS